MSARRIIGQQTLKMKKPFGETPLGFWKRKIFATPQNETLWGLTKH